MSDLVDREMGEDGDAKPLLYDVVYPGFVRQSSPERLEQFSRLDLSVSCNGCRRKGIGVGERDTASGRHGGW